MTFAEFEKWYSVDSPAAMRARIADLEARLAHAQSRRRKALEREWYTKLALGNEAAGRGYRRVWHRSLDREGRRAARDGGGK